MPPVPNPVLVEMQASPDNFAELADKLRSIDILECAAMGWTPRDALWFALADCPDGCWAVGSTVRGVGLSLPIVGAFGFNRRAGIWSLWADLSHKEAKAVLRLTTAYTKHVLEKSQQPMLGNWMSTKNAIALRWMESCPYYKVDHARTTHYGMEPFVPFTASLSHAGAQP